MTDANRILDAADKAASNHFIFQDVRPVVAAVLRELAKGYDEYTEGVIGDELTELANEIEGVKRH